MKQTFKLVCLSLLALTAAGCGKKVLIPEKTITAAYIDLEKAYKNGKGFANTLIDALPSEDRKLAKKKYDESLKIIDKIFDNLNAEWAVVTFGGDLKGLARAGMLGMSDACAIAAKVDADEDAVKKVLKDAFRIDDVETNKKHGHVVFEIPMGARMGLIDEQYLIISPGKDAFDDMFDLYAGKGKASKEFADLSKISGNTICRVQTAPVSSLLKRFELTREIEKFGEASEDEELANMILDMGALTLDVDVGDEVGLAVHVACDSSSDAKIIENLMRGVAFLARVGCDFGAFGAENPEILNDKFYRTDAIAIIRAKDIFVNLAKNIEADRSWSVATLSVTLETEKIADFIRKMTSEDEKKKSSSYDDDTDGDWRPSRAKKAYNTTKVARAETPVKTPVKPYSAEKPSSYSRYRKDSQKAACIDNMRQLQTAAEVYMINHESPPSVYDLCGPDKLIRRKPTCPLDNSSYRIYKENGEIKVSCSNAGEGHTL